MIPFLKFLALVFLGALVAMVPALVVGLLTGHPGVAYIGWVLFCFPAGFAVAYLIDRAPISAWIDR